MDKQIQKSNAQLAYIQGTYIRDPLVVIDDPTVFNALPGKHEWYGIKTIASWPIFVTALLGECYPLRVGEPAVTEHAVREVAESYARIPHIRLSERRIVIRMADLMAWLEKRKVETA